MRRFQIRLTADDNDTFLVTCPALPEVATFGETESESAHNAVGAIEEALAARIARGAEIPSAADVGEVHEVGADLTLTIVIPALSELKVELYRAMKDSDVTRAELARRLDWNRNSVDRLFRLDHASRLEQIEAAAQALGLKVRAEIVPEAAA